VVTGSPTRTCATQQLLERIPIPKEWTRSRFEIPKRFIAAAFFTLLSALRGNISRALMTHKSGSNSS